jgi:hypothetical protein
VNPRVYNAALATGVALVSIGVGCWSLPAALVVAGSLVLALTIVGAALSARRP